MSSSATTASGPLSDHAPVRRRLVGRQARVAYIFLAPAIVYFSVFFFYPIAQEVWLSFHTGSDTGTWNGLDNYRRAFADDRVWHSFRVTALFAIGTTVGSIVIGLGLALLLDQRLPGRIALRSILLFPYMISFVIVGLMWRNILDPYVGVLNGFLLEIGLPQQFWLTSYDAALPTIIGITIWQSMGYNMVLFLAGLQGIPREYYEAARVDGASGARLFFNITLPLLAPTTLFVSVIGVIGSLQAFAQPYIITQGGPAEATNLYVYHVFNAGFGQLDFGYASALAFLMFLVILVLTIVQLRIGRNTAEY